MKKLISVLFLLGLSSLAEAQDCSRSCDRECLRQARNQIRQAEDYLRDCGANPGPGPGPIPRGEVAIYDMDNCSSGLVAYIHSRTDCSTLRGTRAWGATVNGQCLDLEDTTADVACYSLQVALDPRAVWLHKSDSCNGAVIAAINRDTDCASLARMRNVSVWGVKINGRCEDISDVDLLTACRRFGGR
jgi:hypothetical protein